MGYIDIVLIAIALAMDAFAVSICKGLTLKKMDYKKALVAGTYFGFFQALMPLIGFFIGSTFAKYIEAFDHWIAFVILILVGLNMIKESFSKEEANDDFSFKSMIILAIATSIDALSMGLTFSMSDFKANIFIAVLIIGMITFFLSGIGVLLGNIFGSKFNRIAQIIGGIVLILIGIKILLEGLNIF